jgi:hypothetical protein
MWTAGKTIWQSYSSQKWQQTQGIVIVSAYELEERIINNRRSFIYNLQIQYQYIVGEQTFTGVRIRFGQETNLQTKLQLTLMGKPSNSLKRSLKISL